MVTGDELGPSDLDRSLCSTDLGRVFVVRRGGTPVSLGVSWNDYAPGLQAKIDTLATARDCVGLQLIFNQIGATNLVERNHFGHGNEEILKYIDAKENALNCY